MNNKVKSILVTAIFGAFIIGFMFINTVKNPLDISKSERRKLNQFPNLTLASILDTSFMSNFEKASLDQFIRRDTFRQIKAFFLYNVLHQKDNNDIYIVDGQVAKYNNELNEKMIADAGRKLNKVTDKFLNNMNVYYSVIPDKNYFLAKDNGYPSIDYETFISKLNSSIKDMTYIDIFNTLTIDDFYTTDTHWKQESISKVVNKLGESMGFLPYLSNSYETIDKGDFYGVYYGQSALPLKADKLNYLTNDVLENTTVKVFDEKTMTMVESSMYNEEKLNGNDAYDLFLSGAVPLVTIENPNCNREKELYIFRDSYGSSLAPLMVEGYSKITLIDLRYIASNLLTNFIEFKDGSDALFIYCVDVFNNSTMLKVF